MAELFSTVVLTDESYGLHPRSLSGSDPIIRVFEDDTGFRFYSKPSSSLEIDVWCRLVIRDVFGCDDR